MTPRKHAIKADLMKQMRGACLDHGCREVPSGRKEPLPTRPTIVVVGENFNVGHAVYRTHSRAVAALRERFKVVGVIHPDPAGTPIANLFDECLPIKTGEFLPQVKQLADAILERKPDMILYLGVGMVAQVIALASLRLAPVQCVSFGHTATTMSEAMDYFIVPEDFAGAAHTLSEKVLNDQQMNIPHLRLRSWLPRSSVSSRGFESLRRAGTPLNRVATSMQPHNVSVLVVIVVAPEERNSTSEA
jgi:hypothetical protein